MFSEAAETYRRLIWVEIRAGRMEAAGDDLSAMEALVDEVKDPMRRRASAGGLNELRGVIGAPEADLQTMSHG